MRVTVKGQVTIPRHIRKKLSIVPHSEVDFVEEGDRVYLVNKADPSPRNKLKGLRGVATIGLTTDDIMALTRGEA